MKGIVTHTQGTPRANSYIIKGDDNEDYFAHIGDLKENEELLYRSGRASSLEVDDEVEFDPIDQHPRAIRIKKTR